jgi:hypothetical protein
LGNTVVSERKFLKKYHHSSHGGSLLFWTEHNIVQKALGKSGKNIPIQDVTITIGGEKKEAV